MVGFLFVFWCFLVMNVPGSAKSRAEWGGSGETRRRSTGNKDITADLVFHRERNAACWKLRGKFSAYVWNP